jgi:hypothetical protein
MEALACVEALDLDDAAFLLAYWIDRMNAKSAITDWPGHDQLRH